MPVQYCLASAAATTTTEAAAAATKLLLEMQFSVLTRQQVGGRWLQIAQNKIVSFCHKICLRKLEITCLEKDSITRLLFEADSMLLSALYHHFLPLEKRDMPAPPTVVTE